MPKKNVKTGRMSSGKGGTRIIALCKTPTHIQGLDEILEGGLPEKRTTLLIGDIGSGKTVMGVEFLYRGALNGEPGIFLGFEETSAKLRENALTLGWDLAVLEADNRLFLMEGRLDPETVVSGKLSLKPMLAIISGKAKEMGARRIVLDALDVLFMLYDDPVDVRAEIHRLNQWLAESGLTAVITLRPREEGPASLFQDFFKSMADCALSLNVNVRNQVPTRSLRVIKYRGSNFGGNEYPYLITEHGIRTNPITIFALKHRAFGERVTSGIPRLDAMLAGGYLRSSCVMLAGEPGTGKTLLAASFARDACGRGEKAFYLSFEESPETLVQHVASAGIDLKPCLKTGKLQLVSFMPESMGVEEHLLREVDLIEKFQPQHVIVDAISACDRMRGKPAAFDYLMRLMNFLKDWGTTTVLTKQTSGAKNQMEIFGSGISSMVDTVIYVGYEEADGETNRTIQVLKSRGSSHSNQAREFVISNDGVQILDLYLGPGGVLTGTARHLQEARDALEERKREADIQAKTREIERLKAELDAEAVRLRLRIKEIGAVKAGLEQEKEKTIAERQKQIRLRRRGEASNKKPSRAKSRGRTKGGGK